MDICKSKLKSRKIYWWELMKKVKHKHNNIGDYQKPSCGNKI